jgi:hypothetical protein
LLFFLYNEKGAEMTGLIPIERIESKILLIRGQKVLLDRDLAELYGVETRVFNQAVKRNLNRFPCDFMFALDREELTLLMSQNVISNEGRGGVRKLPYAFTEHGAIMAASVLKSQRAIDVSVSVVRTFVKMREMLLSNSKLAAELRDIEERMDSQEMNTILLMDRLSRIENKLKGSLAKDKDKKIGFNKE